MQPACMMADACALYAIQKYLHELQQQSTHL
jgi:hypothetical protein